MRRYKNQVYRNDRERRLWVMNDEALRDLWRISSRPLTSWIRENRKEIDTWIDYVLNREPVKT